MRQKQLVLSSSPCDLNFHDETIQTIADVKETICPFLKQRCEKELSGSDGLDCIMLRALHVVQNAIKENHSIKREMKDFREFFATHEAVKGFAYSSDRESFEIITGKEEALRLIQEFAHTIMGEDNKTKTEASNVGNSFEDVINHAINPEGIDLEKISKLKGRFGTNGGRGCDVNSGPCSCGAWH